MGGQLELEHLPQDAGEVRVDLPALGVAGAAEDDVVQMVDGAGRGRGLVGGGTRHHVGPHRQIQRLPREHLPQAVQVGGGGQVHREVVGEEIHVELVRHGHADNLPPDERGLGLLGPGELVHRQIHLEPQVPDGLDDALMAEGEGIEGAGEEGGLLRGLKLEGSALDLVEDDEAVDMGQRRGGVEEGQLLLRLFADEEQQLFADQGEEGGLLLIAQGLGGEQAAQDVEGLLPHRLPPVRQSLEEESRHPPPAGAALLAEASGVDGVVLQHGPHGGQGRRHNVGVGGGEEDGHLDHHLVQLPGRQPQDELAQVLRNILGDLRLSGLQGLGHLHGDLVAPVRCQHRGDGQQGRPGHPTHHHVLADLDEVGEMGCDVEGVGPAVPLHLVQQVLHAGGL